jgi:hypothetical protein
MNEIITLTSLFLSCLNFIIAIDQKVNSITVQQVAGSYTLYPFQK